MAPSGFLFPFLSKLKRSFSVFLVFPERVLSPFFSLGVPAIFTLDAVSH